MTGRPVSAPSSTRLLGLACGLVVLASAACGGSGSGAPVRTTAAAAAPPVVDAATQDPEPTRSPVAVVEVPIRLVRAVDDAATAGFAQFTAAVLNDPRGWRRAGFAFRFSDDAPSEESPEPLCGPEDVRR